MTTQTESTLRRAQAQLLERERSVPVEYRLAQLDKLERDLGRARGAGDGLRVYVLALQILDVAAQERVRAAELQSAQLRTAAASKAGQARAAQLLDVDVPACRRWAVAQGIPVPDRGRFLPGDVVELWRAAGAPA